MILGKILCLMVAVEVFLLPWHAGPLQAQESYDPSASREPLGAPATEAEGWHFAVVPYAWFTTVSGTTSVRGLSAPVDASFSDIFSDLNIAAMGQLEARKDNIGFFTNIVYSSIGASNTTGPFQIGQQTAGPVKVDVSMDFFVADVAIFFRAVDLDLNGGLDEGGTRLIIEPYTGARVWNVGSKIRIPIRDETFKRTKNETWVDAIIGFRSQWEITDRWNVSLIGDIGGFAGGSSFTAQGTLAGGYRFGLFGRRNANVLFGYRVLYDDFSTGSDEFGIDLTLHGPVLGLAIGL